MWKYLLVSVSLLAFPWHSAAQGGTPPEGQDSEFDEILALDIAELTVTSVGKRAQKLTDVPAAVYVITNEDLRRSGVTAIPQALRMVPGMQVAHAGSNRWAVSARGFNNTLANKLLVMIDGRSIYTPVFSGTYWDDQSTLIEDIDRIEVIRGPGGSLWGANAVNGIINIITKHAAETQGTYLSAATGTEEYLSTEGRYGGKTGDLFYRAYAQFFHRGKTETLTGAKNADDWHRTRAGFRADGKASQGDAYTIQGDVYGGEQGARTTVPLLTTPFTQTAVTEDNSYGGNILGRWSREISPTSKMSLQAYVDHYTRQEYLADQHISIGDIEFQHNLRIDDRNDFLWGAGYRFIFDNIQASPFISFREESKTYDIFSAFLQDEYALIPNRLFFTFGSKFEHNHFTGVEVQPSARLAWHPAHNQTVWAAVSRAVRTPSSVENDIDLPFLVTAASPLTVLHIFSNQSLKSEELIAYELGHRIQPTPTLSFDTALFFHDYARLTTAELGTPFFSGSTLIVPYTIDDMGKGNVYGAELAATWNITEHWELAGTYHYINMDLEVQPASNASLAGTENLAPRHQFSVRSYANITPSVQWDNTFYYVENITRPADNYLRYDMRIGWQVTSGLELSLIGRSLLDSAHSEFPSTPNGRIERSVLGRAAWKF